MLLAVNGYIAAHERELHSQTLGNFSVLFFGIVGTAACARAARRGTPMARGWTLLTLAALLWTLGQAATTFYGATRNHVYPFPSLADVGYLGYAVPAIAGILSFPRPARRESGLRGILDALVITSGVLFVSWATVLEKVVAGEGLDTLGWLVRFTYPITDIAICSLVLALGMRQPAGQRLLWTLLGSGLVVLAVSDTTSLVFVYEGRTALNGTPMIFGWMAFFLLLTLATLAPVGQQIRSRRDFTLALELIPYVPVMAAFIVAALVEVSDSTFLLLSAGVLLLVVGVRQIFIVYDNVTLTRDLESKVKVRTEELNVLGSIVTSSSDAIVGISLNGVVASWNPAAEALYGHRVHDVVGRAPDFLSAAQLRRLDHLLKRAERGQDLHGCQLDWARSDGSTVPVNLTISPILDQDAVRGISIFGQDSTEGRRSAETLEAARQEALESSRLKSEFLATMSHEIRTPMNGVIGLTNLLLDTSLDDVQRQYAEGVHGAGESLLTLINDILDFSKLEAGKIELEVVDFDPRRLVEEVGALLAPTAFGKNLELLAYCLPEVPTTLRGDVNRVRQVLLNLASNAVKFTSKGEVAVKVRSFPHESGCVLVRVEVSDTGIGIADADRQRLFQSFSQADASTTRRYGGTGLGLAISLRLVEAMGGRIALDSEAGVGSTFRFEVPLAVGSAAGVDSSAVSHDLLAGMRVLIVDDNATTRSMLALELGSWRLQPDAVKDAASALDQMKLMAAEGRPYDIAVLDMGMPQTDGIQLAQEIWADPVLQHTAMILLTSTPQVDAAALRRAGIREWLTKPVRNSELYDRLMSLMAPDHAALPTPGSVGGTRLPTVGSKGRVLVVEDNSLNQLVAERVVSRLGYQVDIVANGEEALNAVDRTSYSALLMDCHMPVMDGFEATKEIRRREGEGRRTPIIAMTAGALPEDRERCLAAGMDDYTPKPVDVAVLGSLLAHWIETSPFPTTRVVAAMTQPAVAEATSVGELAIDHERLEVLRELGSNNDTDFVTLISGMFIRDSATSLVTLREAAEANAADDVVAAAHKLRGASGNVGANCVALLCGQLEATAPQLDSDQTSRLLDQLEVELLRATQALETFGQEPALDRQLEAPKRLV